MKIASTWLGRSVVACALACVAAACAAPVAGALPSTADENDTSDEPTVSKKKTVATNDTESSSVTLTKIDPASVAVNAAVMLTLTGANFDTGSTVVVNNAQYAATVTNPTTISVTLPASVTAAAASLPIHILNPTTQDVSNDMTLTVGTGAAATSGGLTSLSPTTAPVGAPSVILTVNGSGFDATSRVVFNGSDVTTTFLSATSVQGAVPSTLLQVASTAQVSVRRGGVLTTALPFTITGQAAPVCQMTCASLGIGVGQCTEISTGDPFEFLFGGQDVHCDPDGCARDGC